MRDTPDNTHDTTLVYLAHTADSTRSVHGPSTSLGTPATPLPPSAQRATKSAMGLRMCGWKAEGAVGSGLLVMR
jgi:hypothetical protein